MKCAIVVIATFLTGKGDEELRSGHEAMVRKYQAKVGKEIGMLVQACGDVKTVIASLYEAVEKDGKEVSGLTQDGKVGLYLCCHGGQTTIVPDVPTLVSVTLMLCQELQLPLAKINLNACLTAGAEPSWTMFKGINPSEVTEAVIVREFCSTLVKELVKRDGDPVLLDGVMVAAYRAIIIYYEPNSQDPYFTKVLPDEKKISKEITKSRNTFLGPNKTLLPPYRLPTDSKEEKTFHETIHKIAEAQSKKPRDKQMDMYQNHRRKSEVLLGVEAYLLRKLIFRFDAKSVSWKLAPVSQYTDNADLKSLVKSVEPLWGDLDLDGFTFKVKLSV